MKSHPQTLVVALYIIICQGLSHQYDIILSSAPLVRPSGVLPYFLCLLFELCLRNILLISSHGTSGRRVLALLEIFVPKAFFEEKIFCSASKSQWTTCWNTWRWSCLGTLHLQFFWIFKYIAIFFLDFLYFLCSWNCSTSFYSIHRKCAFQPRLFLLLRFC